MITIEKIEYCDIGILVDWFKKEHIREYWFSIINFTEDMLFEKYTNRLKDLSYDMSFIVHNEKKIGYIQSQFLNDLKPFKIKGVSKSIDIFIGEEQYLGKGYGTEALIKYIEEHILNDTCVVNICIDPEDRNKRAIRSYEKVGFRHCNTAVDQHSKLLTHYMYMTREDFYRLHRKGD